MFDKIIEKVVPVLMVAAVAGPMIYVFAQHQHSALTWLAVGVVTLVIGIIAIGTIAADND